MWHEKGLGNISDVYWDIRHYDGTGKDQVHGELIPKELVDDELGATWDGSQYQIVDGYNMWNSASYNGTEQLTEQVVEDPDNGLVIKSVQEKYGLYKGYFDIHKHQPCGPYLVENWVVTTGSEVYETNYIFVHCFIDLQLDFDYINWGGLAPGGDKSLDGNLEFGDYIEDGASGSEKMTVGNGGSGEMQVGVAFTPLQELGDDLPKLITEFDAGFGISPANLYWYPEVFSGDEPGELGDKYWFPHDYWRTLCANETGKLDLSVHPPETLPNGEYAGKLVVYGKGFPFMGNNVPVSVSETENNGAICANTMGYWFGGVQRPEPLD